MRYAKNEAEADDLFQDSFVKTFAKLNQFKHTGALGGWIRRIAVTTALEHLRKQKMELTSLTAEMASVLPDEASEHLFQTMDLDALVAKIQTLPLGYRTVFNLHAIEGYSHKEIGNELGISIGTSKSQFSRARQLLMSDIAKEEEMAKKSVYGQ